MSNIWDYGVEPKRTKTKEDVLEDFLWQVYSNIHGFLDELKSLYKSLGYDAVLDDSGDTITLIVKIGKTEREQEYFEKNILPKVVETMNPKWESLIENIKKGAKKVGIDANVEDATNDGWGLTVSADGENMFLNILEDIDADEGYYIYYLKEQTFD